MQKKKILFESLPPLKITYPRLPPYKTHKDYIQSRNTLKNLRFGKQEWDKPGQDPCFHLLATQRVHNFMENSLKNRREFAKGERQKLEDQWKDLEEEELKFQDTFVKLSPFIRSNEEKRIRAKKTIQEDGYLKEKRTEDIENLLKEMQFVDEWTQKMERTIRKLSIYEKFLNDVVGLNDDFKNADDLIARYESLVSTKILLGKRQDENLSLLETARTKTAKMVEDYSFKILGLNNKIADLNTRYNTAFRRALRWENVVLNIKKQCFDRYQEMSEVRHSCWNLYLLMCKRKNEEPKLTEDDLEQQLIYIKRTLEDLGFVNTWLKNGVKKLKKK